MASQTRSSGSAFLRRSTRAIIVLVAPGVPVARWRSVARPRGSSLEELEVANDARVPAHGQVRHLELREPREVARRPRRRAARSRRRAGSPEAWTCGASSPGIAQRELGAATRCRGAARPAGRARARRRAVRGARGSRRRRGLLGRGSTGDLARRTPGSTLREPGFDPGFASCDRGFLAARLGWGSAARAVDSATSNAAPTPVAASRAGDIAIAANGRTQDPCGQIHTPPAGRIEPQRTQRLCGFLYP